MNIMFRFEVLAKMLQFSLEDMTLLWEPCWQKKVIVLWTFKNHSFASHLWNERKFLNVVLIEINNDFFIIMPDCFGLILHLPDEQS